MQRNRGRCFLGGFVLTAALATIAPAADARQERLPDPKRVAQLAQMLPEAPRGVGRPIGDRLAWQAVAERSEFRDVLADATQLLSKPIPELTDELFLDYSRTGNRTRCQRVLSERHGRLPRLVLAECIENRGRFLRAIEESIRAVCGEKTWVMPAHDRSLRNFREEIVEIDLAAAALSWNLATTYYWLGDKLSPPVRDLIRSELERRTYAPFESMIRQGKPRMWWLTTTNNWNAVCLAGVTGSALTMIDSPERRAFFAASAEKYVKNLVRGFTDDGYCTEGVGYWNYGFGHYVMLAETIHQATGGRVDLMDDAKIARVARFGRRMEITPGIYPPLADCRPGTQPDTQLMAFLSRRYRLGLVDFERDGLLLAGGPSSRLFALGLFGFENSASKIPAATAATPAQTLRDWFSEAGVLICRPAPGSSGAMGVALKGGHNAEHHNHNDVGTYLVAIGGATPLVDPGAEVYTARTFSSKRYDSGVLNSFGHPVPRVAGKLQRTGGAAAGKVLFTEFTDRADTISLDVRSAYDVPSLTSLTRKFVFSREGSGSLSVTDDVVLSSPAEFGTAVITFSQWKRLSPSRLLVGEGAAAVEVTISTGGAAFEITADEIHEDLSGGRVPVRLGIDLVKPTSKATITLTITAAPNETRKETSK